MKKSDIVIVYRRGYFWAEVPFMRFFHRRLSTGTSRPFPQPFGSREKVETWLELFDDDMRWTLTP